MTKIWNVAVVGAGIGRSHIAEGYNALPDKFRELALCDTTFSTAPTANR
jgi:hypothetical protein